MPLTKNLSEAWITMWKKASKKSVANQRTTVGPPLANPLTRPSIMDAIEVGGEFCSRHCLPFALDEVYQSACIQQNLDRAISTERAFVPRLPHFVSLCDQLRRDPVRKLFRLT